MILLFLFAFPAALVSLFTGFLHGVLYYSGAVHSHGAKKRLRRHHLITLGLFAAACWAGLNL